MEWNAGALVGKGVQYERIGEAVQQSQFPIQLQYFSKTEALIAALLEKPLAALVIEDQFWDEELAAQLKSIESRPFALLVAAPEAALQALEKGADQVLPHDCASEFFLAALVGGIHKYHERWTQLAQERVIELASDTIEIVSTSGKYEYVNPEFLRVTRYDKEDVIGHSPAELLRSRHHDATFYEKMELKVNRGETWSGAYIGGRKDGSSFYEIATISPICDISGAIQKIVAVKRPVPGITETPFLGEFKAEIARDLRFTLAGLASSEAQSRTLIEAAGDAILVTDFDSGHIVDANSAARELFGYTIDSLRKLKADELTSPDARQKVDAIGINLQATGKALESRLPMIRSNGEGFWATMRVSSYDAGDRRLVCAIIRDVSEMVLREDELAQTNIKLEKAHKHLHESARLAALGELAASVAHEVNNPLQFIRLNLRFLEEELSKSALTEPIDLLRDINLGFDRIQSVIKDLLPFARGGEDELVEVNLNDIVKQAAKMAATEIRHRAKLELLLSNVPPLVGHREKLGQIFTNLLLNAAQAIHEGSAEQNLIRIITEFDDTSIYVKVQDTGEGVAAELVEKVFEPFFTTKSTTQGTGLGLSLCSDIAHLHSGQITIHSDKGIGTTFCVQLPLDNGLEVSPKTNQGHQKGTLPARVLLIDDEPLVLKSYSRVLRAECEVVSALGGDAAIELLKNDQDFGVILCDLMMPSKDGVMIYEYLVNNAPSLAARVVFCTGGVFTERIQKFIEQNQNTILHKPISPTDLLRSIDALDRST